MRNADKLFIDGRWVEAAGDRRIDVVNPATETVIARIPLGDERDVDRAVAAARAAYQTFSRQSRTSRMSLLDGIARVFEARIDEVARAMRIEMGAPSVFARDVQAQSGLDHIRLMRSVLEAFEFEAPQGTTLIAKEPIGVCGLITPWNWPINQIACKVAPAIAAGCTMVLKPSEVAPLSAVVFAEILAEAGVPAGVFNLVHGDGPGVGQAIAGHPDIDLVSFTGSTRAGIEIARNAAPTVKRVLQELGGNSANIILPGADLADTVAKGVAGCFLNSGQSCDSPARLLVPADRMDEAMDIAGAAATAYRVGDPEDPATMLGPLVSKAHFDKVQALIAAGIAEGATLVTGGPGRPEGLTRGWFARPTVFGRVRPDMTIARTEIFGPVLSIIAYADEAEAIRIANDTEYGLAAYVQSRDIAHARRVAARLRAGTVQINYPDADLLAPFGGYKRSGNGREYGAWGLEEFLEVKSIIGHGAAAEAHR